MSRPAYLPNRGALRLLLVTNSFILLATAMLAPIYALLVAKVGGNLLDASATGAVFALSAGVAVLFSGSYSDRKVARRRVVAAGYCMIGTAFLLYVFVHSVWWLLGVQVLAGIGEAVYAPAFDGLYSNNLEPGHESRQWGNWEASHYFSTAVGAVLGGIITSRFGFNALFGCMAALCFASAIATGFVPNSGL